MRDTTSVEINLKLKYERKTSSVPEKLTEILEIPQNICKEFSMQTLSFIQIKPAMFTEASKLLVKYKQAFFIQ